MPAPTLTHITLLRWITNLVTQTVDAYAIPVISTGAAGGEQHYTLPIPDLTALAAGRGATELASIDVCALIATGLGPDYADVVIAPYTADASAAPPAPDTPTAPPPTDPATTAP